MRILPYILFISVLLGTPLSPCAGEPDVTARLLVSNPSPYLGEEIDLFLEVTYRGHPGGRTHFNWPRLDNFVSADSTAIRSNFRRDNQNRLIETVSRRIKPLKSGTLVLREATVRTDQQTVILAPFTLRVQQLPIAGRPAQFNHRIGTYNLTLAMKGTGPREISLHIYDSNQLAPVPEVDAWPGIEEQLISLEEKTRPTGGGGREHILSYFYSPEEGSTGSLRFSLPFFDPQRHSYNEIETSPAPKPISTLWLRLSLSLLLLVISVVTLFNLKRHPRTIDDCLQRLCRKPTAGLTRDNIQVLVRPHLDQDGLDALIYYWNKKDILNFKLNQQVEKPFSYLETKNLRKSLWKAIDKQQDNP